MNSKFKRSQKVILIGNRSGSMFDIGQIGCIEDLDTSSSFWAKQSDGYVYLIKDETGFCDHGGTWSFACDLKLFVTTLNKNTKTI